MTRIDKLISESVKANLFIISLKGGDFEIFITFKEPYGGGLSCHKSGGSMREHG